MVVARWKRWTADERELAVSLATAGVSVRAIAADMGRSMPGTLLQVRRAGVVLRCRRVLRALDWGPDEDELAVELLGKGWTLKRIGQELGRSESAVCARLKRRGVAVEKGRKLVKARAGRGGDYSDFREPTEAELDAMIAHQLRPENLPPWWADECDRMRRTECEAMALDEATVRERSVTRVRGRGL